MSEHPAPAGVVLHAPDGTQIACAARWVGCNSAGVAIWRAEPAAKLPKLSGRWELTCAPLPPRTRLVLDGPWTGALVLDDGGEQDPGGSS